MALPGLSFTQCFIAGILNPGPQAFQAELMVFCLIH